MDLDELPMDMKKKVALACLLCLVSGIIFGIFITSGFQAL